MCGIYILLPISDRADVCHSYLAYLMQGHRQIRVDAKFEISFCLLWDLGETGLVLLDFD